VPCWDDVEAEMGALGCPNDYDTWFGQETCPKIDGTTDCYGFLGYECYTYAGTCPPENR